MNKLSKLWIWVIIENNKWEILVVEEKETREYYSKFKWDISTPFWKVWDNNENEDFIDALYREVLEETWLDLKENKYLPCELWNLYLSNIKWEILFNVKLFHVKLNWVLKKYEEKILNNEIKNSYFMSKEDFEIKIKEWLVRAGADIFYKNFQDVLAIENAEHWEPLLKRFMLNEKFNQKKIVIVWPWSKYNLKKQWK